MKKYFKYYVVCWTIALVAFNVITFTATAKTVGIDQVTPSFWMGYTFIMIAFIGNLICSMLFFKEENKNKVFLTLPIVTISYSALCVSLAAGLISMILLFIPYWIGMIIDLFVLAFYAVAVIKASAAANLVSDINDKIKNAGIFIRSLSVDASSLMAKAKSDEVKEQTKKIYEAIRYSDPMSSTALSGAESQIIVKFGEFSQAVESDSVEDAKLKASELLVLINDRNKKCMLLK